MSEQEDPVHLIKELERLSHVTAVTLNDQQILQTAAKLLQVQAERIEVLREIKDG